MRWCVLVVSALAACEGLPPTVGPDAAMDAAPDAPADATVDALTDVGPLPLAAQRCGDITRWAEPLRDYHAAGDTAARGRAYMRGVQDLAVFEDRLYFAYGDANINLGRVTPIEMRAFHDDQRPVATAEFRADDEQIEQYRELDGDLWVAGVDATEDAWLGNVYHRARSGATGGARWIKRRTVTAGVHVHDVAWWRGALWAVGSGSAREDWMRGDIYGHLWRSDDRGESFAVAARHHNMGVGDARLVRMLPLAEAMLLFGYRSNASGQTTVVNLRWDGVTTSPLADAHPLRAAFALETLPLRGGGGLVRAAVTVNGALVHRAFLVGADGVASPIASLVGRRVLDATEYAPTGEVMVLSAAGDDYRNEPFSWSMRVDVTRDFEGFAEVAAWGSDTAARAVAAWRGHVYFGTDEGDVWRCELGR